MLAMISQGSQFDPLGTRKKKTGKDKVTHAYLLATRVRRTHRVASVLSHSLFTSIWPIYLNVNAPNQRTEVERAFLIHFQKYFLNKVFIRIKIARKFKFYA